MLYGLIQIFRYCFGSVVFESNNVNGIILLNIIGKSKKKSKAIPVTGRGGL
jgi:hypothetical protein